jgi:hypothetical protein
MKSKLMIAFSLVPLASCGPQHQPEQPTRNANSPVIPAPSAPPAVTNSEAPPPVPAANQPTLDPKSTEAALELVQKFADLLNEGKFDEAYMLLAPNAPPRNEFDSDWRQIEQLSVKVGKPGKQEGAAGSIYISIPLNVWGVAHGEGFHQTPTAIIRRVNDVPGSTEAQRHWHIERIDWGK